MMIVQMDKVSAPSPRERIQRLYEKNIELENKRRKSAQARIPSDPNAWQQMRENYEAIILEDHSFSEQHNVEYALWQLHYRRIEELRAHFSAALASTSSNASQGGKVPGQPDRITKIRLQFKTFLSEATGFYHDLIVKIRAKYGLPLGYFSEDSDSRIVSEKDGKKSTELKKGLISCHRCLIYLGDLARYKGLYGEGDSKTREYAAASSYYRQAASLWPSSGNPHHQLAIVASYSADEFVAVYRYFRSLAVENPFTTARDNLIVAFEKNRQSYSQLQGDVKVSITKESPAHLNGKGRGRGELKHASRNAKSEASVEKMRTGTVNFQELLKSFCIRFVRLNGILFTRTSLETFAEVLSSVRNGFCELLSSGKEEKLHFGADATENGMFIVQLVSILIFTVHNVKKEAEGQTYAEIVQRAVLLQNAFISAFELMGPMLERAVQLPDISSSFLLPGILVFMEWLACCPDVVTGTDSDEKQADVRIKFWNHCINFLNTLLSFSSLSIDDNEDDNCFNNMSRYEEGETDNRLALWEDFELRGFLPLLPAQTILEFSRKHPFGSDGVKEKLARAERILAAGKALVNVVKIDQKTMCFDARMKKFVIGEEFQISSDEVLHDSLVRMPNDMDKEILPDNTQNLGLFKPNPQLFVEGEEDDEVIVFKPLVTEKQANAPHSPKLSNYEGLKFGKISSEGGLQMNTVAVSVPSGIIQQQATFDAIPYVSVSGGNVHQHLRPISVDTSNWLSEEAVSLASSLKSVRFMENGHMMEQRMQNDLGTTYPITHATPIQRSTNMNSSGMFYGPTRVPEAVVPSKVDVLASSAVIAEGSVKASAPMQTGLRKSPVSRPLRHLGPPPGFSPVPQKQVIGVNHGSESRNENPLADDYSWLDGYQLPPLTNGSGINSSRNLTLDAMPQYTSDTNGFVGTVSFPFPGKQVPPIQLQNEDKRGWQKHQAIEHLRAQEQLLQQQFVNANQHPTSLSEQYHGNQHSIWNGRYIV